eukprot:comp22878_c1_seq1/m.36144 comp22878_c1_seq1/g.36144  ORF comp22878_c1_seq1/g.36144 comp22878_c1_seq1/m.36144 type:complete len:118 (-) comp22878_c1_seq1:331-684(-)
MSGAIAAGIGMTATAYGAKLALEAYTRYAPIVAQRVGVLAKTLDKSMKGYYRGGFEATMTKREAGLILGVSPMSDIRRVREAHRRIMMANHPDKGGSPFLASKINEAKDILEGKTRR